MNLDTDGSSPSQRVRIVVRGTVQGVGINATDHVLRLRFAYTIH
jgi:hypothetical protein